ncbi:MAG: DUF2332 domain-containing protein [Reyranellaceae bacterium]
MPHSAADLARVFRRQAHGCERLGSPLWAQMLRAAAADIEAAGPVWLLVRDWDGELEQGALALRVAGGLHYLALAGQAPALAALLPSCGGSGDGALLWPAARDVVAAGIDRLRPFLDRPPQTNEVGRCCALMPGMLEIARLVGLPLRPREIGSSAGLNQFWDLYAYRLGEHGWRGGGSPLTLHCRWHGDPPALRTRPVVASRAGCDINPLDLRQEEIRLRLQAYVWPDQEQRLANLRAAMATALDNDVRVERIAASAFAARELAQRPSGECLVLYHSIVRQYFPPDEGRAFDGAIAEAGAAATGERPVAWLRLEENGPMARCELRLTLWPGGQTRLLGTAHPHGASVTWLPPAAP